VDLVASLTQNIISIILLVENLWKVINAAPIRIEIISDQHNLKSFDFFPLMGYPI
jgi:hypothetical protein